MFVISISFLFLDVLVSPLHCSFFMRVCVELRAGVSLAYAGISFPSTFLLSLPYLSRIRPKPRSVSINILNILGFFVSFCRNKCLEMHLSVQ